MKLNISDNQWKKLQIWEFIPEKNFSLGLEYLKLTNIKKRIYEFTIKRNSRN